MFQSLNSELDKILNGVYEQGVKLACADYLPKGTNLKESTELSYIFRDEIIQKARKEIIECLKKSNQLP